MRKFILLITFFFVLFSLKTFAQNKYFYRGSIEGSIAKGIPYSESVLATTHGVVLPNDLFIGIGAELSNWGKGTKFFNNKGGHKFEKSPVPYYYIMGDYPLYKKIYTPIISLRLGSQKFNGLDLVSPAVGFRHTLSKIFTINVALFYEWKRTNMKVDFDPRYIEQLKEESIPSDNLAEIRLNSIGVRLAIEF